MIDSTTAVQYSSPKWTYYELRQKHNPTTGGNKSYFARDKTNIIDRVIECRSRYHRALWNLGITEHYGMRV